MTKQIVSTSIIRAGRFTAATSLVCIGGLLLWDAVSTGYSHVKWLKVWWPLIPISWVIEVVVTGLLMRGQKKQWKVDFMGISASLIVAVSVFLVAQPNLFQQWVRSIQFDFSMMKQMVLEGGVPIAKESIEQQLAEEIDQLTVVHETGDIYIETAEVDTIEVESIVTVYEATQQEAEVAAAAVDLKLEQAAPNKLVLDGKSYTGSIKPRQPFQLDIKITIPEEKFIELDIQVNKGNVYAQRPVAPIYVQANEGDIRIVDALDRVEATTSKGDIECNDIKGMAVLYTMKGNVYGQRLEAGAELQVQQGNMELNEINSTLHAVAHNGNVTISSSQLSGYWSIENLKGDVSLALPQDVNMDVDLHSLQGSIMTNYSFLGTEESAVIGSVGEGGVGLRVRASGSILLQHKG
ncbi:DUF4097 family beta strand repeat-containing protein [Paenibacillus arenosi]|uniref:DUF4097 family beta strand repeat protein n=1 Tax=Paenibacillus arenosi TaxID=2774142 RepID=A0ABR9AZP9_9BACL|nr:DUF4097 family beta strand repeat-containing protein [Paenibacillus arenosi]MBD8499376.1 DUF4097 family beta strand repeat protein [Paenibacillus arenosi]